MKEKSKNITIKKDKTKIESFQQKIKESIFNLVYVLLKTQNDHILVQIINIIFEFLQMLAFPFSLIFSSSWKNGMTFVQISFFFNCFQLVSFLKDNMQIYLIVFYLFIIIILCLLIWITISCFQLPKNNTCLNKSMPSLKIILQLLSSVLYLPILQILLSIFNCINQDLIQREVNSPSAGQSLRMLKVNYYAPELVCYEKEYTIHMVFGGLVVVSFLILCLMITMTLYDSRINSPHSNTKISCYFDKVFLIIKTLLCFLFCFFPAGTETWLHIGVLCLFSIMLLFTYIRTRPYLNHLLWMLYFFSLGLFAWACFVLLISKILENTPFNAGIVLFFIGIPFVLAFISALSNSFSQLTVLLTQTINIRKGEQALNQIRLFLYLFNHKDKSRRWKILLKGYAHQYETTCLIMGCPLKRYLFSLEKGSEINAFLLQHAEILFRRALSKFPSSTALRIGYCFFLIEYLNQRQQAAQELLKTKNHDPTYAEEFIIYRFKRLIEEQITDVTDAENYHDQIENIAYRKHVNDFKQGLTKATASYIEFWNILLSSSQNQDQLSQLNEFGSQIQEQVQEVKSLFEQMQKIKPNDQEVIYYYFDFYNDILNDKEKAKYYQSKLNQMEETKQVVDDTNLYNIDTKALTSTDEYQYIILSGRREDFGIITNVSIGVCSLLGYYKEELIGKAYEILLPEIFHKMHRKILNDKVNKFKKDMTDLLGDAMYNPTHKEITTFARNKARYLVPITLHAALVSSESNGISFIAKLSKEAQLSTYYHNTACYIITNNQLIIQNFSANSVNMLKMNSNAMSKSIDISTFIKQFREDYLNIISDQREVTPEIKLAIKRQIVNTKFRSPILVNWKIVESSDLRCKSSKFLDSQLSNSVDYSKLNKLLSPDSMLLLSVSDAMIGGKQEGYIFKFTSKATYNSTNITMLSPPPHHNSNKDLSQLKNNTNIAYMHPGFAGKGKKKSTKDIYGETLYDQFRSKLPEGNSVFNLDTQKLSYVVNTKEPSQIREEIRKRALEIIQQNQYQQSFEASEEKSENQSSEVCTSSYESESDDDDEPEEVEVKEDKAIEEKKETQVNSKNLLTIDTPTKMTLSSRSARSARSSKKLDAKVAEDYHRVSMTNIKYLVYSYKKNILIEVPHYARKSQVEIKMYDYDSEDKLFKSKKSVTENEKVPDEESKEVIDQEGILVKQIDQALEKEEKQTTIVKLKLISFFIFSFSILFDVAWVILTIIGNTRLNENYVLIKDSAYLIINSLFTHADFRDLTLLSHENYTNYLEDLFEQESQILIDEILELFHQSHELNVQIITSPLKISVMHHDVIFNQTLQITSIRDDFSVGHYNMTLSSAFIEMNTAAFHITKNKTNFYPTSKYVFFYLHNLNNEVYNGLKTQEMVFVKEFVILIDSSRDLFIIVMAIAYSILVCSFFAFERLYDAVVKKKESYISAFLEIKGDFIKTSLKKCEQFSKKMQSDSFTDFLTSEDAEHEEQELETCPIRKKKANTTVIHSSRETIYTKIGVAIFIGMTILASGIHFLCYVLFLNQLNVYIEILNSQNDVILEHLIAYRNIREYVFDETLIVDSQEIGDVIPIYFQNFFSSLFLKTTAYLSYRESFPTSYAALYTKLYHTELCDALNISKANCKESLDGASQYGLTILLSVFIEEMREMKNRAFSMRDESKKKGYHYNLTLNGVEQYFDCFPPENTADDYFRLSPINLFNDQNYQKIKFIYKYFLKPAVRMIFEELSYCFESYIYFYTIILISVNVIYFLLASSLFLIVWQPYENKLNRLIYQTKNMLSILPREVLLTISNIVKLLNITQKYNPSSKSKGK